MRHLYFPVTAVGNMATLAFVCLVLCCASVSYAQSSVTPVGTGSFANPYQITVLGNLVWMSDNASLSNGRYYKQLNDINAAATAGWHSGAGFVPIGQHSATPFQGNYDGSGMTISGLYVKRSSALPIAVGLFGFTNYATVSNLGMTYGTSSVSATLTVASNNSYVGGLAGCGENSTFNNCYVTGTAATSVSSTAAGMYSNSNAGGLIGYSNNSRITNCFTTGGQTGNVRATSSASTSDAYGGGLVGSAYNNTIISNCYATKGANVSATRDGYGGGLVGFIDSSSISNSYASGNAAVTAPTACSAGLVGYQYYGAISYCYSTGAVSWSGTNTYAGGLLAYGESATINYCFWDTQTSGRPVSVGGLGKTTVQMKQRSTFANWDFTNTWTNIDGATYPSLQIFESPTYTVTFNANGGSGTMNSQTYTAGEPQALNANTFTRINYTFTGWNTTATGSGASYTNQQSITLTANITLYAQWALNTYTVTFNANGGNGTMTSQTYTHGVAQALKANTFTRTNYTFTGWNTAANGSGTSYANQQSITRTADLALYAQWNITTYTITYNANGGSGTMAPQVFTAGVSKPLTANSFTRAGYTFKEWNMEPDGSGTVLADKRVTTPTRSYTLYAQWTINVGALNVTLLGPSTAQWRISGTVGWTNSGVTVGSIAVGIHTVEFKAVTGFDTPTSQQVTVTKDATATLTVDYRKTAIEPNESFQY